jgi:uncharacterized linocin/CFP29 family protein
MKSMRFVGVDEQLSTEQGQVIRDRAVTAARRQFIGRKLFPIGPILGEGAQTFGYDTLTEVSDARIDVGWPGSESKDIVNLARTSAAIPTVHKEFEIPKLDLASSRLNGTPLNLSVVDSAAYKVALQEDSLLILGWSRDGSNYDINGLYNSAGNTESSSLDYGTKANIETSLLNAIGLLEADGVYAPYNMVLNPTQYAQTLATIANTGITYREYVEKTIEGTLYQTPAVTAGTGLICKANADGFFEYVMAEDLSTYTEVLAKSRNLWGRVYVRGLPVVYDANAICQLTTI